MKLLPLSTLWFAIFLGGPCVAQQQLVWPSNPQLGGFPAGHPGIPTLVAVDPDNRDTWRAADLKFGDTILLELTNTPAIAYLKLFKYPVPIESFIVPFEARVISLDDDKVVAEIQVVGPKNTDADRIVTITSTFLRGQLTSPPKFHDPFVQTSNENEKKTMIRHASLPRLRVNSFASTRMRTWRIEEEINE